MERLEENDEIEAYVKLPGNFYIPTPMGKIPSGLGHRLQTKVIEVSLFYCRNQSQRFLPTRSENRRGKDRMCQKTFCEDKRWEA